ncbi:MAG: PIG-L family deacetylase [Anaerolineae bacterium]|nr:PIG-L family deacetylase [Anaerolineae bacterium]
MTETNQTQERRRVMGIFAHPDDPEFFAGGTFARWAAEGAEITFVLATSGDKGSDDPDMTPQRLTEIREQEERNAAAALGVQNVIFLRYPDGELQPTLDLKRDLVRLIRLKRPDVVVTCDPALWYSGSYINHTDHRVMGQVALDAVSPAARNRLYFPELERDEGLPPHGVQQVYIAAPHQASLKVDVTAYIEAKINALREHKSQIKDMDALAERIRSDRDKESPKEYQRYTESFFVITFNR